MTVSRKFNTLLAFTALTTLPVVAFAQTSPNTVFINADANNTVVHDLPVPPANGTNDTLIVNIAKGTRQAAVNVTGNKTVVLQKDSSNTNTNVQQNGANNTLVVTYAPGATNSNVVIGQGNSPEAADVNKFPVNVANKNFAQTTVAGSGQSPTIIQKGDSNVSFSDLKGANNTLLVVQEMRDTPNDDIVDSNGNHYKGGSDDVTSIDGTGNSGSVNSFNGNVTKQTVKGNGNSFVVTSVNKLFDANRKYNNVSKLTQTGNGNRYTGSQAGAGNIANVTETGDNHNATVTQGDGGAVANVILSGTGNSYSGSQSADSTITHIANGGSGNRGSYTQTGGKNVIDVTQGHAFNGGNNSVATVTQTGDRNLATGIIQTGANDVNISQSGVDNSVTSLVQNNTGGTANKATITQTGEFGLASVSEKGTNNNVVISPNSQYVGLGASQRNSANAQILSGNNNSVNLKQVGGSGDANVTLGGDTNTAKVDQQTAYAGGKVNITARNGNNNDFNAIQTAREAGGIIGSIYYNGSYVGSAADHRVNGVPNATYANAPGGGPQTDIFVGEGSNNNVVKVDAEGQQADTINLYGSRNTVRTLSVNNTGPSYAGVSSRTISIQGNDNKVIGYGANAPVFNGAPITGGMPDDAYFQAHGSTFTSQIIGSNNTQKVFQTGYGLDMYMSQRGNNNTIEGYQGYTNGMAGFTAMMLRVNQVGDRNFSTAAQTGYGNWLDITQTGNDNQMRGYQFSANGSRAFLTQTGNGNVMNYTSNATNPSGGINNIAYITQTGNNNNITASILGDNNYMEIKQQGNNLVQPSAVSITGNNKSVVFTQTHN